MPQSKRNITHACVGIAVAFLLAFAGWAVRVEITYQKSIAVGLTNKSSANYNAKPCRLGEQCKGDRDALSSATN
jgi:hypothetical protein